MSKKREQQMLINGGTLHRIHTLWKYVITCLPSDSEEDEPIIPHSATAVWVSELILNVPDPTSARRPEWEQHMLQDVFFRDYGRSMAKLIRTALHLFLCEEPYLGKVHDYVDVELESSEEAIDELD